jgi:hypothetical protein
VAAVSARGASAGDKLFAAKGHAAIAAVASLDTDSSFINKHRNYQSNGRFARNLKTLAEDPDGVNWAVNPEKTRQIANFTILT